MGVPLKIHSCLDKTSALVAMGLLASTFLVVGLAMGYFFFVRPTLQCRAAESWVKTPCQILHSAVEGHRGRKGGYTYNVDIAYRYQAAGRWQVSNRYDFTVGSTDSYGWRAAAVRANPAGMMTFCYVDPQDEANATLSRSFEHHLVLCFLFPGIFSLAGLAALTPVYIGIVRRKKFGESYFELKEAPAPLGGPLEGAVTVEQVIRVEDGFTVKLTCVHRVIRGSGKNRHTEDLPLWENSQRVQPGLDGAIPVAFVLPEDGAETGAVSADDRIFWRLDVTAKVPGVGYAAQFEVPVALAALTADATAEANKLRAAETRADQQFELPAHSRIRVRNMADGKEFYFSALRNPPAAIFLTLFLALWTGVIWFIVHEILASKGGAGMVESTWIKAIEFVMETGVPMFFLLVFGVFEIIIFLFWIDECFCTTRVAVGSGQITVTKHILGLGWPRTVPSSDIREIKVAIGTRMGTKTYYNVQIVRKSGFQSTLTAGDEVEDSHEAACLALDMARLAGVRG
jgi:hypothetical protein